MPHMWGNTINESPRIAPLQLPQPYHGCPESVRYCGCSKSTVLSRYMKAALLSRLFGIGKKIPQKNPIWIDLGKRKRIQCYQVNSHAPHVGQHHE